MHIMAIKASNVQRARGICTYHRSHKNLQIYTRGVSEEAYLCSLTISFKRDTHFSVLCNFLGEAASSLCKR